MKALILAAGKGTRMDHLTNDKPKPLLEVNNKPFIDYVIQNLIEAGIDDIAVLVGYKKEKIINHFNNSNLAITFIEQKELLGTGKAVQTSENWANGEDFIVIMGDNLFSAQDIKRILKKDDLCYVAGCVHDNPEKFGVMKVSGDRLEGIIEKPANPPSNIINTGLYKFTSEIFGSIQSIKKSDRGEYEVTDAINDLCRKNRVKYIKLNDYMLNLGCPEDIPEISKFLLSLKR